MELIKKIIMFLLKVVLWYTIIMTLLVVFGNFNKNK
jgi:hypothetical protein